MSVLAGAAVRRCTQGRAWSAPTWTARSCSAPSRRRCSTTTGTAHAAADIDITGAGSNSDIVAAKRGAPVYAGLRQPSAAGNVIRAWTPDGARDAARDITLTAGALAVFGNAADIRDWDIMADGGLVGIQSSHSFNPASIFRVTPEGDASVLRTFTNADHSNAVGIAWGATHYWIGDHAVGMAAYTHAGARDASMDVTLASIGGIAVDDFFIYATIYNARTVVAFLLTDLATEAWRVNNLALGPTAGIAVAGDRMWTTEFGGAFARAYTGSE